MTRTVKFLDLRSIAAGQRTAALAAMAEVYDSGWFIMGPALERFEEAFAEFSGARICLGVANGLDALVLALRALGIKPGDEVIVPSNTFIATWLAVSHVGAVPVAVEPDEATYCIDPGRIAAALTPRTRAILPVHLYGHPAAIDDISGIAAQHGLAVLEDAAQAHGATYCGVPIGGHGNPVAWSFYPGKNLGAIGDAGAVTTNDQAFADQLGQLRNYGSKKKYVHDVIGFNSRLDPLQAALLHMKLGDLGEQVARRREIARRYDTEITRPGLRLPIVADGAEHAYHLYVVRTPARDALAAHLAEAGIETLIHYPIAPHRQHAYAELGLAEGAYPIAEAMAREVLSLPMGPHLTEDDVDHVVATINSFVG